MANIDFLNVRRNWEECEKNPQVDARWGVLYATINPECHIRLSRVTHEALGSPDSYLLLYDREREVIGLRPSRLAVEKNAHKAIDRGPYGGKRINGYRMCREFGINTNETVRFHHCQIDYSGVLILDLGDSEPAKKRKKTANGTWSR